MLYATTRLRPKETYHLRKHQLHPAQTALPDSLLFVEQDTSPAPHASLHSLAIGSDAAVFQDELMDAIAADQPNILTIRSILSTVRGRADLRRPVLLYPSASMRHNLRTPLMAAAASGLMPIVGEDGLASLTRGGFRGLVNRDMR